MDSAANGTTRCGPGCEGVPDQTCESAPQSGSTRVHGRLTRHSRGRGLPFRASCTLLDADHSADSDGINDVSNAYAFTARRLDAESGLMQYRFRYYAPGLGRLISRDPGDYVDCLCLYAYVACSPLIGVDPFGLAALSTDELRRRCAQKLEGNANATDIRGLLRQNAVREALAEQEYYQWYEFERLDLGDVVEGGIRYGKDLRDCRVVARARLGKTLRDEVGGVLHRMAVTRGMHRVHHVYAHVPCSGQLPS